MDELVKKMIEKNKTISLMESCTGGGISNAITNIPDASKVIKFSAVTYSNEFKIKMGVPKKVIDKYSVYSKEVAMCMAKAISDYTDANFGVGITGKLKKSDPFNPYGEDNKVYIGIYDRDTKNDGDNTYYFEEIELTKDTRAEMKDEVIQYFVKIMKDLLQ